MKIGWQWWVIALILILIVPIIPYENETTDGVVEVGNKCIAEYLFDRYAEVQAMKVKDYQETGAKDPTVP